MRWILVAVVVLAATVREAMPQCLTDEDRIKILGVNQELHEVVDFGFELYKELELGPATSFLATGRNLFFSPYSVWSAFVLAYFGSGGKTEAELESALGMVDKINTLTKLRALELTYDLRRSTGSSYTFNLANRIYIDAASPVRDCIKNILFREIAETDFRNTFKAANDINDFVSETTQGRIPRMLEESDLKDAQMVLVNAAFFKGIWKYNFLSNNTFLAPFRTDPYLSFLEETGKPLNVAEMVSMMNQTGSFKYGDSKDLEAQILELPYEGGAMSMFLLLPGEEGPSGFGRTVASLSSASLSKAMRTMKPNTVNVQLPRFNMSVELIDELEAALKNLGIRSVFDPEHANFSSFAPTPRMSVSKAVHKAFIEVNEEGSEAAAATVIAVNIRTRPTPPVSFVCDRPFIFFIYDNDTENILFLGVFRNHREAL
ncbi:leukocyte elastase inhibitor-like [Penaeus chinensis]|uniref:leukocyte elastase inhibitor-like n=1 Tax=Penaeus chinensis TaxID=139456 RepID=UPI001FB6497D|nr:leukocyte elastase inhibitor-like [Penaeus chinensis]XP_047490056.1 leukocyte elastase inhibitor-like [Penaeus chinensis]XP_047490057.1 leukocyte elastase inhibitor-like [Penaeus chinensis]XP_047490058.1 leukocyte elastase inhibitor-like [Penaeus chinensis]XP_047490059.1 leukocyte elastase inhibitor-like [Penaeus chinensis]XP_047490061.1 leukocyte elastase inhibitor-like [Penaeus chinensis]